MDKLNLFLRNQEMERMVDKINEIVDWINEFKPVYIDPNTVEVKKPGRPKKK
jgi:hypothetical protein